MMELWKIYGFKKKVSNKIIEKTMDIYYNENMLISDAFESAIKETAKEGSRIWNDWYNCKLWLYLPEGY